MASRSPRASSIARVVSRGSMRLRARNSRASSTGKQRDCVANASRSLYSVSSSQRFHEIVRLLTVLAKSRQRAPPLSSKSRRKWTFSVAIPVTLQSNRYSKSWWSKSPYFDFLHRLTPGVGSRRAAADQENGNQGQQACFQHSQVDYFARPKPSQQHGDDRVGVGMGRDQCRRGVVEQP